MGRLNRYYLWASLLLITATDSFAQLQLPGYYGDHMVLQRDQKLTLHGKSAPGKKVTLTLKNLSYNTVTRADSSWKILLPGMKAGGPYTISFSAGQLHKQLQDVYFGEVWFCGGQSNMNFKMKYIKDHKAELDDADYPLIRQLDVPRAAAIKKQSDIQASPWIRCNASTIDNFSAVALQFAKQLYKKHQVPIGIIHSSWGGSPIETFMDGAALQEFPLARKRIAAIGPDFIAETRKKNKEKIMVWEQNFYKNSVYITATKTLNRNPTFFDSADWRPIHVPGFLEDQQIKERKGMSWYKKSFRLHKKDLKGGVTLDLGRINFACATFVNGIFVGQQMNPYYNAVCSIPQDLIREGDNELLVYAFNESEKSGFRPISKPLISDGQTEIPLSGTWLYKPGTTFDTKATLGEIVTVDFENGYPTLAYNAMIHPFFNYQVKGVLWYQGEANATMAGCQDYEAMLSNLVRSWRKGWQHNKLPFLLVQIANYGQLTRQPIATPWAIVQEAQTNVSKKNSNTGIVITNDVGNPMDVHPTDKQTVGKRLAILARKMVYGEKNLVAAGPSFKSMTTSGHQVKVFFNHTGNGLKIPLNGQLNGFSIAGEDGGFYRAAAAISGSTVLLTAPEVKNPKMVRYAFESSPPPINFYNQEGFPGVPFRTDHGKNILNGQKKVK